MLESQGTDSQTTKARHALISHKGVYCLHDGSTSADSTQAIPLKVAAHALCEYSYSAAKSKYQSFIRNV